MHSINRMTSFLWSPVLVFATLMMVLAFGHKAALRMLYREITYQKSEIKRRKVNDHNKSGRQGRDR